MGYDTGYGDYVAIVSLIVAMALLEVVLLAGPAFAVSARRQARTLALMAASGGTPRQARRVVLASGIVLGALAALLGAVLGVVLGLALLPSSSASATCGSVRSTSTGGRSRSWPPSACSALAGRRGAGVDGVAAGRRRGARRTSW